MSDVEELAKLIYPDYHGHNIIHVEAREAAARIIAAGWMRRPLPSEEKTSMATIAEKGVRDIFHRYRRGEIKSADDAATEVFAFLLAHPPARQLPSEEDVARAIRDAMNEYTPLSPAERSNTDGWDAAAARAVLALLEGK